MNLISHLFAKNVKDSKKIAVDFDYVSYYVRDS